MATGDIRVLAENYDALLRHCAYMRAMAVDETVKYGPVSYTHLYGRCI